MHGSVYTVNKPLNTVDEYHYYKTCPRLQDATRRPREHDEDETSGLEECEDCQERREHNRRQRIGLSGPARNLVEAYPEDYPLKTDGGTDRRDATDRMNEYRDLVDAVRTARKCALEADDRVDEMQWIAAGGLGRAPRKDLIDLAESLERNAKSIRRLAEEAPDPREVRPDDE